MLTATTFLIDTLRTVECPEVLLAKKVQRSAESKRTLEGPDERASCGSTGRMGAIYSATGRTSIL